jgi:hypothetical protein
MADLVAFIEDPRPTKVLCPLEDFISPDLGHFAFMKGSIKQSFQ